MVDVNLAENGCLFDCALLQIRAVILLGNQNGCLFQNHEGSCNADKMGHVENL